MAGGAWVVTREGGLPRALFFDPAGWWLDLLLGAAGAGALVGLWRLGRRYLSGAESLERSLADILKGLDGGQVFSLAVLSGFAEELFFRGAVQGSWGYIAATVIFAVLHTGSGKGFRLWTVFAALAGLLLGGLVLWRGNLLAATVAHLLVNLINLDYLVRRMPPPPGEVAPAPTGGPAS